MKLTINQKKTLLEQGIENGKFPEIVYKYRSIERIREILTSSSFYFAKPSSFNDPFDCSLSETEDYTVDDFLECLSQTTTLPPHDIKTFIQKNPHEIKKLAKKIKTETIDKKGILSLSKCNDNILMWSHYADSHKGAVIGLGMKRDLEFFLMPRIIAYKDNYTPKCYFKEPESYINQLISTKSSQWSYEEEIRIFKDNSQLYKINNNAITSIFFGIETNQEDINEIKQLCINKNLKHIIFGAEVDKG